VHEWIDTPAALAAWMEAQPPQHLVALDTEFMRTDTFRPKLALIQANIGGNIALLDAPRLGDHAPLAARLSDPQVLCVMHSASEDLEALAPILPNGPAALFDTQIAAALCGLGAGLSYQKLVSLLLGVDLPKAETRSDWLQRPLSPAQLEYAAQDVLHLRELHGLLEEKLAQRERGTWLAEECRRLIDKVRNSSPDTQPQRAFRTVSEWPRERQAMLRRVLLWRENSARTLDKPRSWILDDARVLSFVEDPPSDGNGVFERSKGLRAFRSPQRKELLDLLQAPLDAAEIDASAPIPAPLNSTQKKRVNAMRDEIARIAAQQDLPEGLLCPRRHLEALVGDGVWPTALEGWRRELLFDALMRHANVEGPHA